MAPPARPIGTAADPSGGRWSSLIVGALAALATVAALAFPFAPVEQPRVSYTWTADEGPAALPLLPYQPVSLTAGMACRPDGVLFATVPPDPDPAARPLPGLVVTARANTLTVGSAGVELGRVPLPAGDCTVTVRSDPARTTVLVDGALVLDHAGDVRPAVAGAFGDSTRADLTLVADTRFQTTISPLKAVIGIVGVLALAALAVALTAADRHRHRVRLLPRNWWRPRPVDAVVTALLVLWWLVGSVTVDDGYIAGIVRSAGENGFVGNGYRWLNAPEAPFSWFYALYELWSRVSASTLWLRLPATLLGLVCWWLVSRAALPRLDVFARRRGTPWLAALAFGTWWVPFELGLRPEPWVAAGGLVVYLAVERAIATRRVAPLMGALVVAGAVTALTPAGLMAFAPVLAAAVPLLRLLRSRTDLRHPMLAPTRSARYWPVLGVLVAAPLAAVYLMFSDQSAAAVWEAIRVRSLIGGGAPWYTEYQRYAALLEPQSFQGAIGRRAAVAFTLLAAVGVLWAVRRVRCGVAAGPAVRLVAGLLLSFAALTASPTKWTQHFGDLAGLGTLVLTLGLAVFSATAMARQNRRTQAGALAAVTVTGALVLAGYNLWPSVSGWFTPTFSTTPPMVAGHEVATIWLLAGAGCAAVLLARTAWQQSDTPDSDTPGRPTCIDAPLRPGSTGWADVLGRATAPRTAVTALLVGVLALQIGGNVRTTVAHRDSYTPGTDALASLRGQSCGLADVLSVETDPAAGLLPVVPDPTPDQMFVPSRPLRVDGFVLPGLDVAGRFSTGWYDLTGRRDGLPVVLATTGRLRPGDAVRAEFGAPDGQVLDRTPVRIDTATDTARDVRLPVPDGATAVRLVVDAGPAGDTAPATVTLPRIPLVTPMPTVLPPGSSAILDWPIAFLFPCVRPAPLPLGAAGLPEWRITPPQDDPAAGITYAPSYGGPFAAARLLVTEQRMATYLRGDPSRDACSLVRWIPLRQMTFPQPIVAGQTVSGSHTDGHARVPGLDPPG